MSATVRRGPLRTQRLSYVTMRDGEVVRVKVCRTCGKEKRVSDDRRSEFPLNGRRYDGGVKGWKADCKPCYAAKVRAQRAANVERARSRARRLHAWRMTDPEKQAQERDRQREYQRRRKREDPEFAERCRKRHRDYVRRKRAEDPEFFSEARRRERLGERLPARTSRPRLPARPFARWLELYVQLRADLDLAAICRELWLTERRARAYLDGQPEVAFDLVDRALLRAELIVQLDGRPVYGIDDLYDAATVERVFANERREIKRLNGRVLRSGEAGAGRQQARRGRVPQEGEQARPSDRRRRAA